MATKFNLTAQLQLRAPTNTSQVVSEIQNKLNGVKVPVSVTNASRATRELANVTDQTRKATTQAQKMGKAFGVSLKRFTAFSIASKGVALFTSTLANAVEESIEFQREVIKISQVTGKTVNELKTLTNTVSDLATSLGVSSKALLSTGRILSQAGIQAKELEVALQALAKTTLAPTFDDITKTAEGAVAIIAQFQEGVGSLERQLGSINAVAGQFAVESGDLISAVRRTGGVFKAAGGDLEELLALFTSVRATTRESAESIATGLRTIFTRIQRPKTIEFLKQYGVELTDLEGKFVGPFEAVRRLSLAFRDLEEGDITFVKIAEELGGFRQIGKVIPLIKEFTTAEKARQAALSGGESLTKDAAAAQLALAVQFQKVKEEFYELVRAITETSTFQALVKTSLSLASALIKVADAFKPLIPLIGAFAAFKAVKGIGAFAGGIGAGLKSAKGFNSGGMVPGSGNRDTVPAMLTPGEFVIRKSSVKKLGAGTLAQMNNNRYASGGTIRPKDSIGYVAAKQGESPQNLLSESQEPLGLLRKKGIRPKGSKSLPDSHLVNVEIPYRRLAIKSATEADFAGSKATTLALNTIDKFLNAGKAESGFPKNPLSNISGDEKANSSLNGYIFEQIVKKYAKTADESKGGKLTAAKPQGGSTPFDFIGVSSLGKSVENAPVPKFLDAARTKKTDENMKTKALNAVSQQGLKFTSSGFTERRKKALGGLIQKFALGGLAAKNQVGFAILDPDRGLEDERINVTRAQIRQRVKGTDAQRTALDKEVSWPKKSYTIARQGLNQKTSEKFYNTLTREAAEGVSVAASALSSDLGLGSITVPEESKELLASTIRKSGSQMGRLFEDVVNILDNKGEFAPASPGAPFDARGGIQGALKDNYSNLPSSFVDYKTSYEEATATEAQKKITREIAEAYQNTSTFKNAKAEKKPVPASALAAQEKRRAKQQAKMEKMRREAGFAKGGAAPSDTVPALLTPGEFVINAKAASKIGPANLNRMNKRGIKGFAKGGFVGVQRFANGGGPKKGSNIDGSGIVDMSGFTNEIKGIVLNLESLKKAAGAVEDNFYKAAQLVEKSNGNLIALGQEEQELKALMNDENASQAEKNEIQARLNDASKEILKENEINLKAQAEENKLKQQHENIQKNIVSEERKKASSIKSAGEARQKGRANARAGTGSLKQANVRADNEATRANAKLPEKGENKKDFAKIAATIFAANAALETIRPTIDENSGALAKMSDGLINATSTLINFGAGLSAVLPEGSFDAIKDTLFSGVDKDGRINSARARTEKRFKSGITSVGEKGEGLGKRISQLGTDLKNSDSKLGKKLGGLVSRGGAGLSQAGGGLVANAGALSGTLTTAATAAASFAAIAGVTVGVTAGLSQAMDALTGVHEKARKAIEEGNVAQAGSAAVSSQLQKDANKAAMGLAAAGAAAGFLIGGPFGSAIGGAIGGLAGLALKTEAGQEAMGYFRDNIFTIFGAETTDLIAKRATVEATAIRNQKEFADNAKDAARAMEDVKDGSRSLTEALESGDLTRNAKNQAQLAVSTAEVETEAADQSFSGFSALIANLGGAASLFGSSTESQQKDIGKAKIAAEEKKRQALNKTIDENRALFDDYGKDLFAVGQNSKGVAVSLDVFRQQVADSLGVAVDEIPPKTLQDLDAKFLSNAKRVTANTRAFAASTVGVQGISDFAEGATSEIGKVTSVLDGSFNSVRTSSDLLSDALSGARVSEESFDSALENLSSGFNEFGIPEGSLNKIKSNVKSLGSVTKNFDSAIAEVAEGVSSGDIRKEDFKDKILEGIIPENASEADQNFLKDFFGNIEFDPDDVTKSLSGDFSGILKTLGDKAGEGFEEIKEAAESVANAQDALVDVTRQRIQVENQFIQAQQQNIALQQEAAQALSDFGINTLTTSEKVEFAQKKLATSFNGRTFTSASAVQDQIKNTQATATVAIQENRGALTGTGPQGTSFAANSDLIAKSQDQLNATIEYSRTRIALYKEELEIVRKKNQAEKDSLDSLLSGDIESFVAGQERAGAASALRAGDASTASLFSSKALGDALKDLRDQGVSGQQLETASSIALQSVGIDDQSAISVLSNNTDEEKAIMAGVEAEAETLRAAGVAQETIASEQLTTAKLGETQAVNALKDAQIKAAKSATEFARSMDLAKKAANKREQQTNDIQRDVLASAEARQKAEINAPVVQAQKEIQASMQARAADSTMAKMGGIVGGFAQGGLVGGIHGAGKAIFGSGDPTQMTPADMEKLEAAKKKSAELAASNEERNQRELDRIRRSYSKGGPVYAKNGFYAGASNMFKNIFKPKGVDTVPAMLQAGEFVMSKKGVQSGNNLNMLKGMNQGMSGIGGMGLENIGSILKDGASVLMKPAETMVHAAEQLKQSLSNTNIGMSVSPFNVNVNFNGASFLEGLTEDIKSKVMTEVVTEMRKMAFDNSGNSYSKKGVL